jgi:PAS domain-containing protein
MGNSHISAQDEPEQPCASDPGAQLRASPRDNLTRLQRILDSIKDYAIITLDRNGCVASWNRGAERLLGYT